MSVLHRALLGFATPPTAAHCERIIALHGGTMPPGWWHAIRIDSRPLFGPPSRFDEAPIDDCRPAVESALAQGFRPVLFVPLAAEWPAVYAQLGPARSVVRICILGRHDDTMRDLLHGPSPELVHAVSSGARLLVPEPEYGRALDAVFTTMLADFVEKPRSESDAIPDRQRQAFDFTSRLNPYRHLRLVLDHENAVARLRQEYRTGDPAGVVESCNVSILLDKASVDGFADGNAYRGLQFVDGVSVLGAASMAAVAAELRLPANDRALWILVAELIKASSGRLFASVSEQSRAAVAELGRSAAVVARIWKWLLAGIPSSFAPALRQRGDNDGPALAVFVSRIEQTPRGLVLRLAWLPGASPKDLPSISVEINTGAPTRLGDAGVEWTDGGSTLILLDLKCDRLQFAWRWDRAKGDLRLQLRGDIKLPPRRRG